MRRDLADMRELQESLKEVIPLNLDLEDTTPEQAPVISHKKDAQVAARVARCLIVPGQSFKGCLIKKGH